MVNLYLLPKKLPKPLNSFSICPFDISTRMSAGISNLVCLKHGLLPIICLGNVNSLPPLSLFPVASQNAWRHFESCLSHTHIQWVSTSYWNYLHNFLRSQASADLCGPDLPYLLSESLQNPNWSHCFFTCISRDFSKQQLIQSCLSKLNPVAPLLKIFYSFPSYPK